MPTFDELLSQLRNPGEDGTVAPSIYDDLSTAYADVVSGSEARLAEERAAAEAIRAENAELKARNYDLLMASSASVDASTTKPDESRDDSAEFTGTVDDLFK